MKYSAYPTYKESGVAWLGKVPEQWEIWKIAHGFISTGSGTTPPSDNATWYDGDIPWVTTSELRENVISDTTKKVSKEAVETFSALKLFPKGSLAIAMYGATIGRLGILDVPATTNQACCVMFGERALNARFMFLWFQAFKDQIILLASGGGQPNISQDKIRSVRVACPGIPEQTAIADFLDRQTGRLDTLVAKKRQLLARLKENRTALISRTVTRGLPAASACEFGLEPHTSFKDSGIEWLGEVPEGWEVKRLRFVGKAVLGLTYSPADVVDEAQGTLVLRSSNVQGGKISLEDNVYVRSEIPEKLRTRIGDILICSRNGSRALIGKNAKIDSHVTGVTFGAFMTIFRSHFSEYLYYVFNSTLFDFQSGAFLTSTINQLTVNNLNNFEVPIPSKEEQTAIAIYLDRETAKIDSLAEKVEAAITRLQEYRTAMITAAVTGKIDVREVAA